MKFTRKLILSLIFTGIVSFSNAQVSDFNDYGNFNSGPTGFSSESQVFPQENNYSGLAYAPFGSEKNNLVSGPVLYGPGGDPIGGLPVSDSSWLLLAGVVAYSLYKLKKKKTSF